MHKHTIPRAKRHIKGIEICHHNHQQKLHNQPEKAHLISNAVLDYREFAGFADEAVEELGHDDAVEEGALGVFGGLGRVAHWPVGVRRDLVDFAVRVV
jgi:hypothetical protein